jgi:hypothetical protein
MWAHFLYDAYSYHITASEASASQMGTFSITNGYLLIASPPMSNCISTSLIISVEKAGSLLRGIR